MFNTIVVGTDGSTEADSAFAVAASLARQNGSRLVAVHVIELLGGKGGQYPVHVDEPELKSHISDAVQALKDDGVVAELIVETIRIGGPAHLIASIADSVDADLIVVGNKGRNPVSEVVLGNVPLRLMHIAKRPVLVVPAAAKSATTSVMTTAQA